MNKVIKKNQIAKNKTFEQFSIFKKNIERYYLRREQTYLEEQKEKIEKFQDKLFNFAVKKNEKISNLNHQYDRKMENYQKLKKDLIYKLEDLKISRKDYENSSKKIEITYQNGKKIQNWYQKKLNFIEHKFEKRKEKLRKLEKIKTQKNNLDLRKFQEKIQRLEKKDIKSLNDKKEQIIKANNLYFEKLKSQLDNFSEKKISKEEEIKNQFERKQIGKNTLDNKLSVLKNKHQKLLEKHAQKKYNFKPLVLNFETLRQRGLRIVNENNDKHFFSNLFGEMQKIVRKNKIIFVILLLLFYTSIFNSYFWNFDTLLTTMQGASEIAILAFAMTFVIITGGIDLSVGSVMAFSAVVICYLASSGSNIYVAILVGILVSTLIGLFNGILIGYARIVPFIVTLSGLLAYRGLSLILANSAPIKLEGEAADVMYKIANTEILGLNSQIWIVIIFALLFIFILKFTVFGRQVFSIGSNRTAARLSGVLDKRVEMLVYTISGFMAGVAGLLIASRVQGIQPTEGSGWELSAIASVVVGGTLLTGGKGGIAGTIVGWVILSLMPTVFITLGYNSQIEQVATGIIIIVAIFFNNNLDFKSGWNGIKYRIRKIWNQHFVRRGL